MGHQGKANNEQSATDQGCGLLLERSARVQESYFVLNDRQLQR